MNARIMGRGVAARASRAAVGWIAPTWIALTWIALTWIVLIGAGALGAAPAEAQPAPRPSLSVGDVFIWEGRRVRQVAGAQGGVLSWRDYRRDEVARTTRDFFVPPIWEREGRSVTTRAVRGDPRALWPLAVGRSIRFEVEEGGATQFWGCAVEERLRSRTRAGTFDAFRVECRGYAHPGDRGLIVEVRYHYAPAIGHFILRDWRHRPSGRRRVDRLEVAIPAAEASRQRIDEEILRISRID